MKICGHQRKNFKQDKEETSKIEVAMEKLVTRISHPSWVSFPFLICSSIGLVDWSLTSNFLGLNIILLYVYQLPIEFFEIFLWVAEFIGHFKISAKSEQSEVCYGLSLLLFYVMSWLSSGDASYMSLEWPLLVKVPKLIAFLGFGWTITSLPSTSSALVLSLLPLLLLFFLFIPSLFFSSFFTHVLHLPHSSPPSSSLISSLLFPSPSILLPSPSIPFPYSSSFSEEGLSPRTMQGLGSVCSPSSGISQATVQEVVLGSDYSPAWARMKRGLEAVANLSSVLPASSPLRRRAQVGLLCCLSYGHAEAWRKGQGLEAVANLSSVLPPRPSLASLSKSRLENPRDLGTDPMVSGEFSSDESKFYVLLESVDHARPWFCPKLLILISCTWFPHRFESVDHARPWFCPKLLILISCTWFPHRFESVDHARPWFCPKLLILISCTWFPHRFESVDHARPWFCPKLLILISCTWFPHRFESEDHVSPETKIGERSCECLSRAEGADRRNWSSASVIVGLEEGKGKVK
uniref:Uncharacterized protein n=1 Tax=Quercus lobata TaxID=97700 RepID=A0A7N2L3M8_QUELO